MGQTSIEWTDFSINPIRAENMRTGQVGHYCEKISTGCGHCYASRLQPRFGLPTFPGHGRSARLTLPVASGDRVPVGDDLQVFLDPSKLREVIDRKKPTRYFWCDMTDMFGSWVPDRWIQQCLATMLVTPWHTHQVLTKRADRMRDVLSHHNAAGLVQALAAIAAVPEAGRSEERAEWFMAHPMVWPLPNVWVGVSVEDQQRADERIPLLLQTPAAVRFLSVEPLLGPVDLLKWVKLIRWPDGRVSDYIHGSDGPRLLSWVIVGGESGASARECDVAWIESVVAQCRHADVKCFVKQLGSRPVSKILHCSIDCPCGLHHGFRDRKGGDPAEWPEDLRVRQFPEARR